MTWMALALMLGAQDPATAVPATANPPAAGAPAAPSDEDRIICKQEDQTGSLFSKKTCLTKAEWKKRRERDRRAAERVLELDAKPGIQSQ